jgi:hypothetical protein
MFKVLRVANCTTGLRQRRLSVYGVVTVLSVLSAATTISSDKIRVLGLWEWSTYFIHESVTIRTFLLFLFRP